MTWKPPATVMDAGQGNRWRILHSNVQLQKLARQAEEVSGGKIHFLYSTQPSATTYYVFSGERAGERLTRMQATEYLTAMIGKYTEAPTTSGNGTAGAGASSLPAPPGGGEDSLSPDAG